MSHIHDVSAGNARRRGWWVVLYLLGRRGWQWYSVSCVETKRLPRWGPGYTARIHPGSLKLAKSKIAKEKIFPYYITKIFYYLMLQ